MATTEGEGEMEMEMMEIEEMKKVGIEAARAEWGVDLDLTGGEWPLVHKTREEGLILLIWCHGVRQRDYLIPEVPDAKMYAWVARVEPGGGVMLVEGDLNQNELNMMNFVPEWYETLMDTVARRYHTGARWYFPFDQVSGATQGRRRGGLVAIRKWGVPPIHRPIHHYLENGSVLSLWEVEKNNWRAVLASRYGEAVAEGAWSDEDLKMTQAERLDRCARAMSLMIGSNSIYREDFARAWARAGEPEYVDEELEELARQHEAAFAPFI